MADGIPKAALKRAERLGKLAEVSEYTLRMRDVCLILGADRSSVRRWTVKGRKGYVLPSWKVGSGRTSMLVFRLYDVERFAQRVQLPFRVEFAPPLARLKWEASRGPID